MVYINSETFEMGLDIINEDGTVMDGWFECDDLIADSIILLNKKGYKTAFCCQSHISVDGAYTCPYIGFDGIVELPNLPDGWVVDNEGVECGTCIYNFNFVEDFINMAQPEPRVILQYHYLLVKLMCDLYDWVCNLPERR